VSDFRELINDDLAVSIAKDAERYRFIRRVMHESLDVNANVAVFAFYPPGKKEWFDSPSDIDDSIDEAMEDEGK
jgi:hypothetical protein